MLRYLFPSYCLSCEEIWPFLCIACKKDLKPHPELCPFCHRVSPHYTTCLNCLPLYRHTSGIIIGFQYTWILKQLIWKLKYNHRRQVAPFLAERLALLAQTHPNLSKALHEKNLIITRVPSHRYRKRFVKGYNQSQLLAEHVADQLEVPCISFLKKVKHTRSQAKLSRKKRLANLVNAFSIKENNRHSRTLGALRAKRVGRPKRYQESPPITVHLTWNETILIIDDITTTWSTINELAETIKRKSPKTTVWWLVIWRHGR